MLHHFVLPVAQRQREEGHYVCFCGSNDVHSRQLQAHGFDVFVHGLQRSLNVFLLAREIARVRRILQHSRIDMLVCHSPLGAGIGRIAAGLVGVPCVVYFAHGLPCAPGQNWLKWGFWFFIEKALSTLAHAVIVMNEYDENLCRTRLYRDPGRVFRVPGMGVDVHRFRPLDDIAKQQAVRQGLGIPPDAFIVLCSAALIPQKGVFVLQEAASHIIKRNKHIYFLLAGQGPCEGQLRRENERLGLTKQFKVLGWRSDVDQLLYASDLFVLPTFYFEGLPVSILEAMACGKPVVATKHRGCEDAVVHGDTGLLVPIRSSDKLSQAILQLASDAPLRNSMGDAGRLRVAARFEKSHCTDIIVATLKEIWRMTEEA